MQDSGQLTVAKVNVVIVLGAHLLALGEAKNDIGEGQQRLVNVGSFAKPQSLRLSLAGTFAARQVHDLDLRGSNRVPASLLVPIVDLHIDAENGVRPGALQIALGFSDDADLLAHF